MTNHGQMCLALNWKWLGNIPGRLRARRGEELETNSLEMLLSLHNFYPVNTQLEINELWWRG